MTMDKAVNYTLNRRDTAETYLEDGRCSFTNNLSENAIRPFAVGRRNWLFSNSVAGANTSAVVYTMVDHDMDVYLYNRVTNKILSEIFLSVSPFPLSTPQLSLNPLDVYPHCQNPV